MKKKYTISISLVGLMGVTLWQDVFAEQKYKLLEGIPLFRGAGEPATMTEYLPALYNFGIWIVGLAALLMIAIGGFWYITSAGNQSRVTTAKKIIYDALLGLFVVLFTWVILNVINPSLTKIDISKPEISDVAGGDSSVWTGEEGALGSQVCVGAKCTIVVACVDCETYAFPQKGPGAGCSGSGPCQVHPSVGAPLQDMSDKGEGDWTVTEMWPPTTAHYNVAHGNGTTVDVSLTNKTAENISSFINSAESRGLRPVYEVKSEGRRGELVNAGVPAENIIVVSGINGEHFSVYGH